jgi:hypothetical protein
MASGIWPRRNGIDFAIMTRPGANAAGTGAGQQTIAQEVKKRPDGRHVAWALNTLLEAESLQEPLIDFSDEFKR